jgi:hypothetical protein
VPGARVRRAPGPGRGPLGAPPLAHARDIAPARFGQRPVEGGLAQRPQSDLACRMMRSRRPFDGWSMVSWRAGAPLQAHAHGILYLTMPT